MNLALKQPSWTIESFLEWETKQDSRFEYDGFEPVAMVNARLGHQLIIRNAMSALQRRLTRCVVVSETVKLRMEHTVRYPDLMVIRWPISVAATDVADPVVVIAVLSDDAREERIAQNEEYRLTPSIQHYIVLEQDRAAATVFSRDGADWIGRLVLDGAIALPEIGAELPLGECYIGVLDQTSEP